MLAPLGKNILLLMVPIAMLQACGKTNPPTPRNVPLQQMPEEVRRNPISAIPLGLNYLQVKEKVDGLSAMRPEGGIESLGREGLHEAVTQVTFDTLQTELEFNFRDSTLYSYYYTASGLDSISAWRLYREIRKQYSDDYGRFETERQDEEGYHSRSSFWHRAAFDANATLSSGNHTYTVSWGFQSLSGNHLSL